MIALLRILTPRAWWTVAVIASMILAALFLYTSGRKAEKEAQEARQDRAEARASAGRETAASERENDRQRHDQTEQELTDALKNLPDARPSDRRVALACERLRQQGHDADLPARCRLAS